MTKKELLYSFITTKKLVSTGGGSSGYNNGAQASSYVEEIVDPKKLCDLLMRLWDIPLEKLIDEDTSHRG